MLSTTSSLIYLFALATTVLACGPPVGNVYSKATFEFTILSPVAWSYSGSGRAKRAVITAEDAENDTTTTQEPANGMDTQATSVTAASAKVDSDVTDAITETLKENNLPADSVNTTIKYTPLKAQNLRDDCSARGTSNYAKYDGTIYYNCAQSGISMADQKGTIVIDSKTAIAEGQWKAIAVKVQDHLEKDSNVVFEDRLKVVFG